MKGVKIKRQNVSIEPLIEFLAPPHRLSIRLHRHPLTPASKKNASKDFFPDECEAFVIQLDRSRFLGSNLSFSPFLVSSVSLHTFLLVTTARTGIFYTQR